MNKNKLKEGDLFIDGDKPNAIYQVIRYITEYVIESNALSQVGNAMGKQTHFHSSNIRIYNWPKQKNLNLIGRLFDEMRNSAIGYYNNELSEATLNTRLKKLNQQLEEILYTKNAVDLSANKLPKEQKS